MPFYDLPLDELRRYRPRVAEPDDFDTFWADTLAEARAIGGEVEVRASESGIAAFDVFDVTFPGFGGHPIRAWLTLPRSDERLPAVVQYLGYGSGRGFAHERLEWAAAGYASLLMDSRGQGTGQGSGGHTPDPVGSHPAAVGYMTRGILDPSAYYFRRLITDAVRAVDAVRGIDRIDPARVAVTGRSQGGALSIAAAALVPELVAALPDVPFLQHFERAVGRRDRGPYTEIARYLAVHRGDVEQVFRTLSYVDGVNFARRARVPALYSVGLMDEIAPPSTVFASFNSYAGPAEIEVYPYNDHEGGEGHHWVAQQRFLAALS